MSAPGQPIDPVEALANQQPAPMPQQQQMADPVEMLAAGIRPQVVRDQSTQAQPEAASKGWADPRGYLSSVVRNATNAATFNLADPAAAALNAAVPIPGYSSTKPTYGERYNEALNAFRGFTKQGQQANPITSLAASVGGGMLNPVVHAMPLPTSLGGAIGQGAAYGGAYGLGSSITNQSDLKGTAANTAIGAGTGAMLAPISYGLGKLLSGGTRDPAAQTLADNGVPLTIGQGMGGTAHTLEDATTHIPVLGNAIKGQQANSIVGFNRATYNSALEPLGIKYPNDGPVGNAGIDKMGGMISDAYDKVFDSAAIKNSPTFSSNLSDAVENASNTLPPDRVTTITKNVNRLINGQFDQNGELSGEALKSAKNWFAEQARSSPAASLDDRATSAAYGKVLDALKGGIAETDPERGDLLNAADSAYSRFLRIQQAASSNNAGGKRAGIYTADQLGGALRAMDTSPHRMNFARGQVPMQDLVQAGQKVLPSTVPDSGSAIRGLVEAAPWLFAGHMVAPGAAVGGAAALGAGTALYSGPGQAMARALMYGAPETRAAIGQIPLTMLPGALSMLGTSGTQNKLAQRLRSQPQSGGQ